jgi:hypothetical protein
VSFLDDVPAGAFSAVWALAQAIAKIIAAGEDRVAREEALMAAAEDLKAELDAQRFGRG